MTRAELARLLGGVAAPGGQRRVIAEADPRTFMAAFASAVHGNGEVFLGNPDWGAVELRQFDELLRQKPETGTEPTEPTSADGGLAAPKPHRGEGGWLMIPTGGTSGQVRFARHDAASISAAVRGFMAHFELSQVNAVGVLPLYHVSGLMAWMRCALTGGQYLPLDWKALQAGLWTALPHQTEGWTISLVPTQLERLLRQAGAVDWLRQFRIIFLGGAPAWPTLLDQAASLRLPLSPGYGMTETAAMIAALRPAEFLAGTRSNGSLLPHARLAFDAEGTIAIGGESVFRGYWPAWREPGDFVTQDAGSMDGQGHLHVSGRRDAVIITGGEKVNPAEVEAVLRDTGAFADVVVFGVPDAEWGESVVAAYPGPAIDVARVERALAGLLSPAKRPKRFVALADWPVNAQGKLNRGEVARRAGMQKPEA
ncbi:2-succinylbenzoate--CoA ligase [Lacunisphaera limnophila]|uniref:2-succinylbenzoate--CoA ligase n=1 Tax=Lacunisphaera limnophila TaxID=1838286 RepID=A0A1D8AY29_9BACT|nr:AMP-binding protein [Lacunisphaera limnophila]AOS45809.1 2-succinylbenzoate--CoA ligase [Lacunisphaera limnophila]